MSTRAKFRQSRRTATSVVISEEAPGLEEETQEIAACLVACQRKFGAYISTPEQRESKDQPEFLAGYEKVSDLKADIKTVHPEFSEDFVDYGAFWLRMQLAGIAKPAPDKMPHRESL